jgi:protein TonB
MRFILGAIVAMSMAWAVANAAGAQPAAIYEPGNGVSLPRVDKEVKPDYTSEAKAAGIEGTVGLNVVVMPDGAVGEVRVEQSLDAVLGLDTQAVTAMKQWTFQPGMKDGKPVAVRVHVEMTFALK